VTLVDRDYDGFVDKIYAVDTGGNVWRIDTEAGINGVTRQVYLYAAVGGSSSTQKRKLLYPPEVVITKNFDAVQFVTGDREHPVSYYTNAQSVHNRFYMIKDTQIGKDGSSWTAVTDTTDPAGTDAPTGFHNSTFIADGGTNCTLSATDKGYYLDFANAGEKGVTKPLTSAGYTYFSTHQPTALVTGQCQSKLGIARSYSLQFMNGCPLSATTPFVTFQGGGIAPSPFSGVVKIGDAVTPFIIGAGNPNSPGETTSSIYRVAKPPINLSGKRYRYYSYQEVDH
jgi:type IV pilus assembly protein PilY1